MSNNRIPVGTEVVVTMTGLNGKKRKGVVVAPELVKGYNVKLHDYGIVDRYPDKKVRVAATATTRKTPATPLMWELEKSSYSKRPDGEVLPRALPDDEYLVVSNQFTADIVHESEQWRNRSQPKPPAPRRSKSYLAFVRKLDCCNCGTPGPSDPHHEGKRGVGQKTSDMLVVPLCRRCHSAITDENQLPQCVDGKDRGRFDRETSLRILHGAQVDLLTTVLERLPLSKRAELLAAAVAMVDEGELEEVLKS